MKPVMRAAIGVTMLGSGLGLAGCELPSFNVEYNESYRAGETKLLAEVPVVVRGDPFAGSQAEFDGAVVDAMQGWSGSSDRFAVASNPNNSVRVVMIFSPVAYSYTSGICERPVASQGKVGAPQSGRVPIAAALCRGDDYLSYLSGSIRTAGGPGGADFRRDIGQAVISLFPVQNPISNGNHNCATC